MDGPLGDINEYDLFEGEISACQLRKVVLEGGEGQKGQTWKKQSRVVHSPHMSVEQKKAFFRNLGKNSLCQTIWKLDFPPKKNSMSAKYNFEYELGSEWTNKIPDFVWCSFSTFR